MGKQNVVITPEHFGGKRGRARLLEAVKAQTLVAYDVDLAKKILRKAIRETHAPQTEIMTQGGDDNDIVLIVSGAVSVSVNGRIVASRLAGTHVGEMAVVDALAKRSATVTTVEPTVTLRLSEHDFSILARSTPDLWRRVAVEIAKRLRERSKFIRVPNNQPVLFIGSSSEGINVAKEVERAFLKRDVVPRLWSGDVFGPSSTAIESLVSTAEDADFAVLVLTADDVTISRRKTRRAPRDNVVLELGLFIGALGRTRVVILRPKGLDLKMPSDLAGVTWIDYAPKGIAIRKRLKSPNARIWQLIRDNGPR